jgi:hypothetical protein
MQEPKRRGLMGISADHLRWSAGLCACARFENVYHLHFQLFSLMFLCFLEEKRKEKAVKKRIVRHTSLCSYTRAFPLLAVSGRGSFKITMLAGSSSPPLSPFVMFFSLPLNGRNS